MPSMTPSAELPQMPSAPSMSYDEIQTVVEEIIEDPMGFLMRNLGIHDDDFEEEEEDNDDQEEEETTNKPKPGQFNIILSISPKKKQSEEDGNESKLLKCR